MDRAGSTSAGARSPDGAEFPPAVASSRAADSAVRGAVLFFATGSFQVTISLVMAGHVMWQFILGSGLAMVLRSMIDLQLASYLRRGGVADEFWFNRAVAPLHTPVASKLFGVLAFLILLAVWFGRTWSKPLTPGLLGAHVGVIVLAVGVGWLVASARGASASNAGGEER